MATNIFVGFHDNRSSSRVLKPPGGGTSNIFGTDRIPDVVPAKPVLEKIDSEKKLTPSAAETTLVDKNGITDVAHQHTKTEQNGNSTTQDVTETNNTVIIESKIISEQSKEEVHTKEVSLENLKIEENTDTIDSSTKKSERVEQKSQSRIGDILRQDDCEPEVEDKKKIPIRQKRIPPGGYSSGLW